MDNGPKNFLKHFFSGAGAILLGIFFTYIILQGTNKVYAHLKPHVAQSETIAPVIPLPLAPEIAEAEVLPRSIISMSTQPPLNEDEEVLPKDNFCPKPPQPFPDYSLQNIGQVIAIPESDYIPGDLERLPSDMTVSYGICLAHEPAVHLEALITQARTEHIFIIVSSGFRSYQTQKTILEKWLRIRGDGAYKRIAKPGYSEHQLGMAVDLSGKSIGNASASDSFGNTEEAAWLEEHAYEYGFVRSYPESKEDITGYSYEPWHYRYVGQEKALAIHDANLTITEYLKTLTGE